MMNNMDYEKIYRESNEDFFRHVFHEARRAMNVGEVDSDISPDYAERYGSSYDDRRKKLRLTTLQRDKKGNKIPGTGTLTNLGLQGYIASFLENGELRRYENVLDEYICEDAVYTNQRKKGYFPTTTRDGNLRKYRKDTPVIYDLSDPSLAEDSSMSPMRVERGSSESRNDEYQRVAFNNIRLLCALADGRRSYPYVREDGSLQGGDTQKQGLRRITSHGTEKVDISPDTIKRYLFVQTMPLAIDEILEKIAVNPSSDRYDKSDYSIKNRLLTVTGDDDFTDEDTRLDYALSLMVNDYDESSDGRQGGITGLFHEWMENDLGKAVDVIMDMDSNYMNFQSHNPLGVMAKDISYEQRNANRWDIDIKNSIYEGEDGKNSKGIQLIRDELYKNYKDEEAQEIYERIIRNNTVKVNDIIKSSCPELYDYLTEQDWYGRLEHMVKEAYIPSSKNSKYIQNQGNTSRLDKYIVNDETKEVRPWLMDDPTVYNTELDSKIVQEHLAFDPQKVTTALIDIERDIREEKVMASERLMRDSDFDSISFSTLEESFSKVLSLISSGEFEKEGQKDKDISKEEKESSKGKMSRKKGDNDSSGTLSNEVKKLKGNTELSDEAMLNACRVVQEKLPQSKFGPPVLKRDKLTLMQYAGTQDPKDEGYKKALLTILQYIMGKQGILKEDDDELGFSFSSVASPIYSKPYPFLLAIYALLSLGGNGNIFFNTPRVTRYASIDIKGILKAVGAMVRSLNYTRTDGLIRFEFFRNYPSLNDILGKDKDDTISNMDYLAAGLSYEAQYEEYLKKIKDTVTRLLKSKGGYTDGALEKVEMDIITSSKFTKGTINEEMDSFYRRVYNESLYMDVFREVNS